MPTSLNTSPTNKKDAASISEYRVKDWWSDGDSNPGPSACKADALPTELPPQKVMSYEF
jgi:hypothetical protein